MIRPCDLVPLRLHQLRKRTHESAGDTENMEVHIASLQFGKYRLLKNWPMPFASARVAM
jgi:hypothetical protein